MEQLDYLRNNSLGTFSVRTVERVLGKSAVHMVKPRLGNDPDLWAHGDYRSADYRIPQGRIGGMASPHKLFMRPPLDMNFTPKSDLDKQTERRVTFLSSLALQASHGVFAIETSSGTMKSPDVNQLYGSYFGFNAQQDGSSYDDYRAAWAEERGLDKQSLENVFNITTNNPPQEASRALLQLAIEQD